MTRATRIRRKPLVALLIALALAVPATVLASHVFIDVPTDSTFHNNISQIKQAGITSGCNPPSQTMYCPSDPVRRDQMSAFLNRGLGRADYDGQHQVDISTEAVVAQATIATPGAGFVLVQADGMGYTGDETGCPCEIDLWIDGPGGTSSFFFADMLENAPATDARAYTHVGTQYIFAVPAAGNQSFSAVMQRYNGTAQVYGDAVISAVWIPFDGTGGAYFGLAPAGMPGDKTQTQHDGR